MNLLKKLTYSALMLSLSLLFAVSFTSCQDKGSAEGEDTKKESPSEEKSEHPEGEGTHEDHPHGDEEMDESSEEHPHDEEGEEDHSHDEEEDEEHPN